jgi:hypothetical protein
MQDVSFKLILYHDHCQGQGLAPQPPQVTKIKICSFLSDVAAVLNSYLSVYIAGAISGYATHIFLRNVPGIAVDRLVYYWDFGLCPSSGNLKNTKERNVSETGSISILR